MGESTKRWLTGLVIIATTIVALFAFWRLDPGVTFVVALIALACLVATLWLSGRD